MSRLQTQTAAAAGTSPAQRKFAQLQRKLESLRATLQSWDQALPAFVAAHAQRIPPLQAEHLALQEQLMGRIEALLDEKGLTKAERAALQDLAAATALSVLEEQALDEAQSRHWQARHDAHAEFDLDSQRREQLEDLRAQLARASGLNLDDVQAADEDELLRAVHARMQQTQSEQGQPEQGQSEPAPRRRRPSASQQRRTAEGQAEQAAAQQQAQQSLRQVFRKLASALHPDRATDAADQARRTALMQRVNQAYARADLLALYALQLEIEQVDAEHVARATAAQLGHLTRVLQQQVDELQQELQQRQWQLCREFELQPASPPKPERFGKLLSEAVAELQVSMAETRRELLQLRDRDSAKRWLRQLREEERELERRLRKGFSFFY